MLAAQLACSTSNGTSSASRYNRTSRLMVRASSTARSSVRAWIFSATLATCGCTPTLFMTGTVGPGVDLELVARRQKRAPALSLVDALGGLPAGRPQHRRAVPVTDEQGQLDVEPVRADLSSAARD